MPKFAVSKRNYKLVEIGGKKRQVISQNAFSSFNIDTLGLGNVEKESTTTDAIAAVFDLEGFTNFCKQIEPHLSVPKYLHTFLQWMMETIRNAVKKEHVGEDIVLWCPLPFFVKFLGDGLLVLWDCSKMTESARNNIISACWKVCAGYQKDLIPQLKSRFVEPPPTLRCGVARGTVLSLGDGSDYVGSCINMAARLQKLPGVSVAFNRRGLVFDKFGVSKSYEVRAVAIRGIGDHELICVRKADLESMSTEDKSFYKAV